ncbi:peptidoglycan editing factor PgeF [Amylibacter sp. SFDW26]|uniref:peptidoglycan editing factor PgeF n=1 Tax=Amylibacter sp. SFDW26 TaxID=2652722 RepID=UPI00126284E8|nr:peptidoglycan editing factor PgeF [Amylibacter sp. SFDW26]KAB7610433.1 peptidoglycan editing factor PgeF [Amylibacter sp. SFDW26]
MTLEILTSDALTAQHGFFTRKGGASEGLYTGLNCGLGSGDDRDVVAINRQRVAKAMDVGIMDLQSVYQIHSADVAVIDAVTDRGFSKADAMVTATKGIALGILTADCAPILFHDAEAGVVGAAHSGWKGAVTGISEATVTAMEGLGAKRDAITAVVGPTISQRAYEVGPEFFEDFIATDMEFSRFFAQGKDDRMQFDLPSFCLHQLRASGVGAAKWTGHCTYSDPDRFFSYRRSCHKSESDYGRLISTIRL